MAKRKRASLKDKSPESLGLTQKKGKGIDLLFGGPSADASSQSDPETEDSDVNNLTNENASTTFSASDERLVDELGLPVALEAPPDDLILASSSAEPISDDGETDAVDPSTSPFAMPAPETPMTSSTGGDVNDLSGITVEGSLPIVEEENLSNSLEANDLSGIVEEGAPPGPAAVDNLSGPATSDLSGLTAESGETSTTEATTDLSGLTGAETDLSGLASEADVSPVTAAPPSTFPPAALPPTTAAPINVSPSSGPAYQPVSPASAVPSVGSTPSYYSATPSYAPAEAGETGW